MLRFVSGFRNGLRRADQEKFMRTHREYAVGDLAIIVDGALTGRSVVVENIADGHAYFKMEMFGADMLRILLGLSGMSAHDQKLRAERARDETLAAIEGELATANAKGRRVG